METIKVISVEQYGDMCLTDKTKHKSQKRTPAEHIQIIENKKIIYDSLDKGNK